MANEFKLSYTGSEINEKLGKIDGLVDEVSQLSEEIGDIDTALDAIIAMQESYIGGEDA